MLLLATIAKMDTIAIAGELPEFFELQQQLRKRKQDIDPSCDHVLTVSDMDRILVAIPDHAAHAHIARCGIPIVTQHLSTVALRPTTKMLLVLDIDETLVDARSAFPSIYIRPYVREMFARLDALRLRGVEVWLWTAAVVAHAARCISVMHSNAAADRCTLPVDGVIVRGDWMSLSRCTKDTRLLPLSDVDRVLLVDNTPSMVSAVPFSSLVVSSYVHHTCYTSESICPTMLRICDLMDELMNRPTTTRVSDFLTSEVCNSLGVNAIMTSHLHLCVQ